MVEESLGRCLSRGIENGICKRGGNMYVGFSSWLGRGRRGVFFERGMELWFAKGVLLREGEVGRVWVLWLRVMGGWRLLVDGSGCGFGGGFLLGERLDWVC